MHAPMSMPPNTHSNAMAHFGRSFLRVFDDGHSAPFLKTGVVAVSTSVDPSGKKCVSLHNLVWVGTFALWHSVAAVAFWYVPG